MFRFIVSIFALIYTVHTSTVFVNTPYEIEDGRFLIFEQYHNKIILNEYPAFYSTRELPKFTSIIDQNENFTAGNIIGSYENYYPITPLKSELMCGHFSLKHLAAPNRTISYRFFTWENVEDFLIDIDNYIDSSLLYLFKEKVCFVYVEPVV